MNNVTFQNNPQDNSRVVVLTRGEHLDAKAAKLDNKTKRPARVGHYNDELAKMVMMLRLVDLVLVQFIMLHMHKMLVLVNLK